MAAKMRKNQHSLRKIANPVISTDVMGNRNVEVRAVGAWVQYESPPAQQEAVLAAKEEDRRIRQMQLEKEKRLKQFQHEVRKRVTKLDRLKKQAQLETNVKATEQERHIVCQSAFSSQDYAKQDNCLVRPMTALTVSPAAHTKKGSKYQSEDTIDMQAFSDQTNQVHRHVNQAKKSLVSRRVITHNYHGDDLPGGPWKISKTRDNPSSRYTVDGEEFDLLDDDLIEKVKVINNKEYDEDKENYLCEDGDDVVEKEEEVERERCVQFDIPEDSSGERRGRKKARPYSAGLVDDQSSISSVKVPNIYEGVQKEEERERARSQLALYRRLYMDIEREQVKENLRRQEHRKRIQRLKKEKEEERVREEQMSQQMIEPRDPVTGETTLEAMEREHSEKLFIQETLQEHERKVRRNRETERYIEALRQQLKDKVRRKRIELPPLCCCGETIWDTNPETCANNCVFYKNPREYGRALQSMLDSTLLQGS